MAFVSMVLAVLEINITSRLFGPHFAKMVDEADHILTGHAILRVFQNRLLGPLLYRVIQSVTHMSHQLAFTLTMCLLLALFYFALNVVLEIFGFHPAQRLLGMLAALGLSTPLTYTISIYLWDPLDLMVMTIFVGMLLANCRVRWLAALICFEALNREVAVLMAGGVVLIGALRFFEKGWAAARAHILAGGVLAVLSAVYAEVLRTKLLITTPAPGWDPEKLNRGWEHFGFQWADNFRLLFGFLRGHDTFIAFQWFLVLGFAGVIVAAWRRGGTWRDVAVAFGILWLATGICGIADEWRIWLGFVPLTVFFLLDSSRQGEAATASQS